MPVYVEMTGMLEMNSVLAKGTTVEELVRLHVVSMEVRRGLPLPLPASVAVPCSHRIRLSEVRFFGEWTADTGVPVRVRGGCTARS